MYHTFALDAQNKKEFEILRNAWHPGESATSVRDSHLASESVNRFYDTVPESSYETVLRHFLPYDSPSSCICRNFNMEKSALDHLSISISPRAKLPQATCLRLIIKYFVFQLEPQPNADTSTVDLEKLKLLEAELSESVQNASDLLLQIEKTVYGEDMPASKKPNKFIKKINDLFKATSFVDCIADSEYYYDSDGAVLMLAIENQSDGSLTFYFDGEPDYDDLEDYEDEEEY